MEENANEVKVVTINKIITDSGDNKPLALRKTPRSHAGLHMYTRMETNNSSSSPTHRSKDNNTKKRVFPAAVNVMKENSNNSPSIPKKKRKIENQDHDHFCWLCHKEGLVIKCQVCPRSYHSKCLEYELKNQEDWVCPECERILQSENVDTQSKAMNMISIDQLCNLLKFAVNRMKQQGDEAFIKPVSIEQFPNYTDYIINPMDLSTLEKNIRKKMYGCTESFSADTKWILHNCIIFNGYQHRLTTSAKSVVKVCKQEMNEIEICPDCYLNAYTKKENWFCEPCREPHLLIWAKLKGFPFWPAKAMRVSNGNIDVRFFGAHDRAWIPVNQCFLLSHGIPTPMKNKKKGSFEQSMEELELHIKKLQEKFGQFHYASFRTRPETENLQIHLSSMLPLFQDPKYKGITSSKKVSLLTNSNCSNEKVLATGGGETEKGIANQHVIKQSLMKNSNDAKSNSEDSLSGVFEASEEPLDHISITELKIPKLDLTRISKPRLESIKNLESTIERIKENVTEKSDDESDKFINESAKSSESDENAEEIIDSEMVDNEKTNDIDEQQDTNDSKVLDPLEKETVSQSCEVTSTTNMADLNIDIVDGISENAIQNSSSNIETSKKSSVCTQKLDQIIESCKAKFGIDNFQDEMIDCEKSDRNEGEENEDEEDPDEENENTIDDLSPEVKNYSDKSKKENETSNSLQLELNQPVVKLNNIKNKLNLQSETKILHYNTIDNKSSNEEDKEKEESGECSDIFMEDHLEQHTTFEDVTHLPKSSKNCHKFKSSDISLQNNTSILAEKLMDNNTKNIQKANSKIINAENDETNVIIDFASRQNEKEITDIPLSEKKSSYQSAVKEVCPRIEKKSNQNKIKSPAKERSSSRSISSRSIRGIEPGVTSDTSAPYQKAPITVINISSSPPQMVPKTMPTLQPRPATIAQTSTAPPPPSPGPGCDMNKYSRKMMDFMRGTFEEMFRDMAKSGNLEASVKLLQLELEKLQWRHQQELAEIKHNTDLILLEMRASMESEKQRAIADVRRQCELEKQKSVEETKKKQWCAHCGKEAIFYCCWNTSYCDYPCQQAHWPQHMSTCAQSQATNETETQEIPSMIPNTSGATNQITNFSNTTSYTAPGRTVSHSQVPVEISPRRDNMQEHWQKPKENDTTSVLKIQPEERERDKQRNKINVHHAVSQGVSLSGQYTPALGPSIQYIPSNAVQVIPQTSSIANSAALQVQYVTNIPSQAHSLAISTTTNSVPQFATMTSAASPQQNHRLVAPQLTQRNPMQISNPVYPIIIQSSQLGLNQSTSSSSTGRLYPRGPYIPGKPYHIS